jgi:FKBP-type peptidyl-prolyl cis-trans isomerase
MLERSLLTCGCGTLAAVAVALLSGCHSGGSKAQEAAVVNANDASRFAYGVGYTLGQDVRAGLDADGLKPDIDLVAEGFEDALNGTSPDMPKAELDRVLRSVHRVLLDRSAKKAYAEDAQFRALADANAARSAAAVAAFSSLPGARMVREGVYEIVVKSGGNAKPAVGEVYVADFKMSRADGTVINERVAAEIDPDSILPHAAAALRTMSVGDSRRFAFAPAQAYGLGGDAPAIGPNEALFVDITVTGTAKRGGTK